MPKLRIIYIVSLVILAVLIGFTVLRPLATGGEYSEVSKEQLLQMENECIIQLDIKNHEGEDKNYTINVLIDGKLYSEDVLIPDGRIFSYIQHIYRDRMIEGNVTFTIYKEGEPTPIEQITYYIVFD